MAMGSGVLEALLSELAEELAVRGAEPVDWVVIGGAAMLLGGHSSRTTVDVDVVAEWRPATAEVGSIGPFEDAVEAAIEAVAMRHVETAGLGPGWVNRGPRLLNEVGLPPGFASRLEVRRFGSRLCVRFAGRLDLVAMKLWAAVTSGAAARRHLGDLHGLAPSRDELERAVAWILGLEGTEVAPRHGFELARADMRRYLVGLGHEDLAMYV